MIKFFRKIRQNLLSEGKTGKYLKYAIGEIVLVVIGILIALQINNWNQNVKNNKSELEILNLLKQDLISSQNQLEQKLLTALTMTKNDSILLMHIHQRQPEINKDSLNKLTISIGGHPTFDPEEAVIMEIINTGKLKIIKNPKIRKFITSWDMHLSEIKEIENIISEHVTQKKEPLYFDNFSYRNVLPSGFKQVDSNLKWDGEQLLDDIRFENIISRSLTMNKVLSIRQKKLSEIISNTIKEIESDINH